MKKLAVVAALAMCVSMVAVAINLDTPVPLGGTITGFRVGDSHADVDLATGTWTFKVYPQGTFGDKEFADLGITNITTNVEITPSDLAAQGIPLSSQVVLRDALKAAIKAKVQAALSE